MTHNDTSRYAGSEGIQSILQLANGLLLLPQQTSLPQQLWRCVLYLAKRAIGQPVSRDCQQDANPSVHVLATALVPAERAGADPTADDTTAAIQSLVLFTVRFISQTSCNAVLPEDEHFFSMLLSPLVFCVTTLSSHRLAGVVVMSMACLAQHCASYTLMQTILHLLDPPQMSKAVALGMSPLI